MPDRKRVAVFFGGRSPEHDVSIITGLQALQALDSRIYDSFPVYVDFQGRWLTGDALRDRGNYMLTQGLIDTLMPVTLDLSARGLGRLIPKKTKLIGQYPAAEFDVALPAFHGLIGEDGPFQGLMDLANVPYTGMRTKASCVFMDKVATKHMLSGTGVPHLPFAVLNRSEDGTQVSKDRIEDVLKASKIKFPCIIKPAHLGSSIGVGKADKLEEARALLAELFQFDFKAIIEPCVENLEEYNIAIRKVNGKVEYSVIERPKSKGELLDFKEKYISGEGKSGQKSSGKMSGTASQGMLSLTRDINPEIPETMKTDIQNWAHQIFERVDGSGCPRLDFLHDKKSGKSWFNELNPCPGSFGYFLWDALENPVYFPDLLHDLIEEAFMLHRKMQLPTDPTPEGARLFPRRN